MLLKHRNTPRIENVEVYLQNNGYQALLKAAAMKPRELIDLVDQAGLRGRGGSGFPTAKKWHAIWEQNRFPHYFVTNIAEGEPGSFKDRELLKNPHLVLESTAVAAHAVGAEKAFLYLKGSFIREEQILKQALSEAVSKGFVGSSGRIGVDLVIHRGEDTYVAGEETAMLESLEGKRAIPRVKPPRPHEYGLWECPTVVNNVETICNTIPIVNDGPAAFRHVGTDKSSGTKLFCLSGKIRKPGIYEAPLGIRLSTLLQEFGGGPVPGRKLTAVFPGGPSTALVRIDLDPAMDFEGLQSAGSNLGTGGVIVLDDSTDVHKLALEISNFFARESCGVCPPCTTGTAEIHRLLQDTAAEKSKAQENALKIHEFCGMMKYRGQCAHCRSAAFTILSLLNLMQDQK